MPSDVFHFGRHEVTQATMGTNPSMFVHPSPQVPASQVPSRPVEQVSWNAIEGFLAATGPRLPSDVHSFSQVPGDTDSVSPGRTSRRRAAVRSTASEWGLSRVELEAGVADAGRVFLRPSEISSWVSASVDSAFAEPPAEIIAEPLELPAADRREWAAEWG